MTAPRSHSKCIPYRAFTEYKERYSEFFLLNRTTDGVLTAKWHTDGGSLLWDAPVHRAIWQLAKDVGQDLENEVVILGGAGHNYIGQMHVTEIDEKKDNWFLYEHQYQDGSNICEGLVFDIQVPTIGVINGPGFHTEMALFCDITLMSDDAVISDPHTMAGFVPGDGIQTAFRNSMGWKRSAYAMLTTQQIDAKTALEYGMVNEVVEKDKIYDRATEIAQKIMKTPRLTRRLTTQIIRAPWKRELAWELRHAFGTEMFNTAVNSADHHSPAWEEATRALGCEIKSGEK